MPLYKAEIISKDNTKHVVENLKAPVITVGRLDNNDLVINDDGVSRKHAEIVLQDTHLTIIDKSVNGIFIGEARLYEQHDLDYGTNFRIADFIIKIEPSEKHILDKRLQVTNKLNTKPNDNQKSEDDLTILKKKVHSKLLDYLDLRNLNFSELAKKSFRDDVSKHLKTIIDSIKNQIPSNINLSEFQKEIIEEALGLGPLEDLLIDDSISEIMVVDYKHIYVEKSGKLTLVDKKFSSPERVLATIERIVTPLGRRIDESTPLVDARLKDGSRVNAVIPPLAIKGPCITIRKFSKGQLGFNDLVKFGSLNNKMARFLERSVKAKKNIVISGGTGSGKTTLLNILSSCIPEDERIVTIEDAAELNLNQEHVVSMETKPPNLEGKGEYSIRDLVKNALRMRPDRIVVGECRGGEAFDMIQAMNTGHDGSLTTLHANSPIEAVSRLETLILMGGMELPIKAIREQILNSVHLIVQQKRLSDGSRKITNISEIVGIDDYGSIVVEDIFIFNRTKSDKFGVVEGEYMTTGYLPSYIQDFILMGLVKDNNYL